MSLRTGLKSIILWVIIFFVVTVGVGVLTFKLLNNFLDSTDNKVLEKREKVIKKEKNVALADNTFNILLLGTDNRHKNSRADTIMLISLDLNNNRIGVISIPRDTRVKLVDRYNYNKINAAYSYGGVELTEKSIEELLDVKIDYYLELDYQGFIDIVDALGGIEVDIDKNLYYIDKADNLYIDLKAGIQQLSGEDALGYVRFRHDALGDIGRIKRQQDFLIGVINRLLNADIILKIPKLIKELRQNIKTNLGLKKMMDLAIFIPDFRLERVQMHMLPGEPSYIEGISYWLVSKEKTEELVNSLVRTKDYFNNKEIEIRVLNGNGVKGIATKYSDLLAKQGYIIKGIGNADNFDYSKNIVSAPKERVKELENLLQFLDAEMRIVDNQWIQIIIGNDIKDIKGKQGF